jgi:predicted transposase/invertase (TIGR01784 family)
MPEAPKPPAMPHDRLFKATFSQPEHARTELAAVLPEALVSLIEWDTLSLVSGEFVDPALSHLQSDLLFEAQVGNTQTLLYLLFEHQSSVDPRMPLRLLRYMMRIWDRYEQGHVGEALPVIVPVVLFHGPTGWNAPTRFRDLFVLGESLRHAMAAFIPDFQFALDDLSLVDDEALKARALTELARLTLVVLQRYRNATDPLAVLGAWTEAIVAVLTAPNGVQALSAIAAYTLAVTEKPSHIRAFFQQLGPHAEEAFVTAADQLIEQGVAQGIEQGVARGIEQGVALGQASLLSRQLKLRFGGLSAEVEQRLATASSAELEHWGEQLLSAPTLEDVFS